MLKFLSFAAVCAFTLARPDATLTHPHVIGGKPAPEDAYPFMVSLRLKENNEFYCGGSLVSERFVLTAGHCVYNAEDMLVGVGSNELSRQTIYEVSDIFVHPHYETWSASNDIGLIKLKEPVKLSPKVQTIRFAYPKDVENKNVTAMGWGYTFLNGPISPALLYLNKKTITNKECEARWNDFGPPVGPGHLCLGSTVNSGLCYGDSGSALLYEENNEKYVVGVVSRGMPCALGYPDIYTRVSYYSEWLKKIMS